MTSETIKIGSVSISRGLWRKNAPIEESKESSIACNWVIPNFSYIRRGMASDF